MLYENERKKSRIFCYLCMVLAGCILANILLRCDQDLQVFTFPFVESDMLGGERTPRMFLYVIWQRVKQLVVIYLLYKVFPAKKVFAAGAGIVLFGFGFVVSCQMFYLGLSGVWFLLICLFPHSLIYICMLYYMAFHIERGCEDRSRKRMAVTLISLMGAVGFFSEIMISKIFLKNFLQYIGM